MELRFQTQVKIQRPVAEVFDTVYNPKKLSAYFTTGGSSGPLEQGATVTWDFADFPGAFPVYVKEVVPDRLIAFEWEAAGGGYNTRVEVTFEPLDARSTLVKITESGWKSDQNGLESSYKNCEGWTQMSCSLKAYLEYNINLRKGFY